MRLLFIETALVVIMMSHIGALTKCVFRSSGRGLVGSGSWSKRSLQHLTAVPTSTCQMQYNQHNQYRPAQLLMRAGYSSPIKFTARSLSTSLDSISDIDYISGGVLRNIALIDELAALVKFDMNNGTGREEAFLRHVMEMFNRKEKLPRVFIDKLLDHAITTQSAFPNVLRVKRNERPLTPAEAAEAVAASIASESSTAPVVQPNFTGNLTVVGDVHGQYDDFAQIFEDPSIGGYPSEDNQFIFNGDLVDRGPMALEIVTTLLLSQLLSPNSVRILRGNHETASMTHAYGFEREVIQKYDPQMMAKFRTLFGTLPIAAVINDVIFVTHGGIGPAVVNMTLDEIDKLDRFSPEPNHNAIVDLLWSDPKDDVTGFSRNGARGGGTVRFGADVTEAFLANNDLSLLIRSHEVAMHGYDILHNGLCVTVFSAPNYCGDVGNLGAIIRFDKPNSMQPVIVQFQAVTVPLLKKFWQ